MATANITINACGGSSDSTKVYYGKTLIVTGDPLSGTGWTLYTGAPISPSTTSVTITGLDDNVEYTVYRYCHCPVSGDTDPEIKGPKIKYVCPTFQTTNASSNQIDYIINLPISLNNVGTWIQKVLVELYDSAGTVLISSNSYTDPFSSTISGSFTGLTPLTSYVIKIRYSNDANDRFHECNVLNIDTTPACVPPSITVSNLNSTSFDVSWTVPQTYIGDTYDIIINSAPIVTGLSYASQPYSVSGLFPNTTYSVQIVRNFAYGGQCTSSTQTVNTPLTLISGTIDLNCNSNCSSQGQVYLTINFSSPTPAPLLIYMGEIEQNISGGAKFGYGYNIFALPPGVSGSSPYAKVINVPSGSTTLNVPAPILNTTGSPFDQWTCQQCLSTCVDLYVKIASPSGYAANFSKGTGNLYHASAVLHNI